VALSSSQGESWDEGSASMRSPRSTQARTLDPHPDLLPAKGRELTHPLPSEQQRFPPSPSHGEGWDGGSASVRLPPSTPARTHNPHPDLLPAKGRELTHPLPSEQQRFAPSPSQGEGRDGGPATFRAAAPSRTRRRGPHPPPPPGRSRKYVWRVVAGPGSMAFMQPHSGVRPGRGSGSARPQRGGR